MTCWLCGNEEAGRHHLGCMRVHYPALTIDQAVEAGLIPPPSKAETLPESRVEVLKEGTMTTVPEEEIPAKGGETVEPCEFGDCENPKYSASPRAKYCAEHKDPKNRKE